MELPETDGRIRAVCVVKTDDLLCRSYALTIRNDKVIDVSQLTRADDLPAVSIGLAQRELWAQMRTNRESPGEPQKSKP